MLGIELSPALVSESQVMVIGFGRDFNVGGFVVADAGDVADGF